ncbi:MAG: hypothetical protein JXP34_03870 [Planctomycetes bacterium]|nr:hypothetical protein [Planctomycetota bacterium]
MESWSFWIIVYLTALAVVGWGFREVQKRSWWKCLFLPALLVEGLARILTAKIAGQKIVHFGALKNGKRFVELGDSPRPWVGPVVRLVAGQAIFLGIFFSICPLTDAAGDVALTEQRVSLDQVPEKVGGILALFDALARAVSSIPLDSPWTWVGLYAAFGLAAAFAVDRREWAAGALIIVLATSLIFTLDWLGFTYRFLSRAWWIQRLYVPDVAGRFAILCAFILGSAAVGLVWRAAVPARKKKKK